MEIQTVLKRSRSCLTAEVLRMCRAAQTDGVVMQCFGGRKRETASMSERKMVQDSLRTWTVPELWWIINESLRDGEPAVGVNRPEINM